jgi:hypothetical protein
MFAGSLALSASEFLENAREQRKAEQSEGLAAWYFSGA